MNEQYVAALQRRLAASLAERGLFREPWLRGVYERVPRHHFVPDTVWWWGEGGRWQPLHREQEPQRWAALVYHLTDPLITQVDDGFVSHDRTGREPTSSISAAGAVLNMLASLDPRPGDRVLEVGTGTGYNAALLSERVGERNVVTVEVDPVLAAEADKRLAAAGYHPEVVCADGTRGHPPGAPFDRLIATASVRRVPPAWLEQVRPDGEIVTPWYSGPNSLGLIWLRVRRDGTARGWFHGTESFMPVRAHRTTPPGAAVLWQATGADARRTREEPELEGLESAGAGLAFRVMVPGVTCYRQPDGWFFATEDATSWADMAGRTAHRHGPRDLIAEARDTLAWWRKHNEPSLYDFGITVTADGQTVWLLEEANTIPVTAGR